MKGDKAICGNPDCRKEFIKKRYDQNCCGSSTCRVIYNRLKNGQPKYPSFIGDYQRKTRASVGAANSIGSVQSNGLASSAANAILGTAGAALTRSVAGGSFIGNAAGAVVTSSLIPYLKSVIGNRGFSFSKIDNDLDLWRSKLKYWQNEKANATSGAIPINALGGAALGGLLGSWVGKEENRGRDALIGAALFGFLGAHLDSSNNAKRQYNQAEIIADAERHIGECHAEINRLTNDRGFYESVIEEKVLVQNEQGVYVVNDELLEGVTSAADYKKNDINAIDFVGSWKYLLGNPSPNFYKIVTGSPGNGKTTYSVQFADYFAKNHGKVLYFPAEQFGNDKDFQNLLKRVKASKFDIQRKANECSVRNIIGLVRRGNYKMIVLDSVNYMKISSEDIQTIRTEIPSLAIVAVMQSTKDGNFRGGQEYKHDCNIFVKIEGFMAFQEKSRSAGVAMLPIDKLATV